MWLVLSVAWAATPLDAVRAAADPEALHFALLGVALRVDAVPAEEKLEAIDLAIARVSARPTLDWQLFYLRDLFESAATGAPDDDGPLLDRVATLRRVDDAAAFWCLQTLLGRRIDWAVAAASRDPAPLLVVRPTDEPPPDYLVGRHPALADAWRAYRSVEALRPPLTESVSVGGVFSDDAFVDALFALLRDEPGDHLAALSDFTWGLWCDMGREVFEGTRRRALFLAALRQRRAPEIAVYAVDGAGSGWSRDALAWLGLDPVRIVLGAALDDRRSGYLVALARYGGDDAAQAVLLAGEVPESPAGDWRPGWLEALAGFVPPDPSAFRIVGEDPPRVPPPVARATARRFVRLLDAAVHEGAPPEEIASVVQYTRALHRREFERAYRRAAAFGDPPTAERAAEALDRMREGG